MPSFDPEASKAITVPPLSPMAPPDTDALMAQLAAYLAAPVVDVTAHARLVVVVRDVLGEWLTELGHG